MSPQLSEAVCKDEKESREESSAREKSSAAKAKEVTSELTTAKQSSYRRAQKTTPIVRRRVPRQLTPTETESKQVCKDEKESREESSAREKSSAAKAKEVTSELTTAKQSSYRRAQKTTPVVRRRVPRQFTPTETESKQVCKDEKESREKCTAREKSSAAKAEEVTPDFECNVAPVHEEKLRMGAKSDFSGSKIGDDFECYSKSCDEKAMPDVPQWLTEEYKETEEKEENIKIIKGDTTVTSSAQNIRLETEFGTKNKMEENVLSEEELDCDSFTESSGYERKMAELNEKSRRLKAQFAEENRKAVESMNKTMEKIKQSQAREDCITNEIEEIRRRRDEIKEDLKRLDEIGQRRELKDKKWREKMDKKKKRVANRLQKIRTERRKYQEGTADENDSTEGYDQPDKNSGESSESEKNKDFTIGNETVINKDAGNQVLRELYQIIEYKSVKELEKKRKEVKQLKRLEKKAIKREKLEQRERKKIEKQKRKVARKLEKLSAKSSKVSEETKVVAKCINEAIEDTNTTATEKNDDTPRVNGIKPYVDTSSDIAESKQVQAPHSSGLITNGAEVEKLGETLAEVDRLILGHTDSVVDETADSQQSNPEEEMPRQDNFDCFPDEVEGDMHTEESRSQVSQSAENEDNEKNVHECDALPRYEQSVAAVVNITEYFIQQERKDLRGRTKAPQTKCGNGIWET
ncbi:golgin subfamily A member 6-like protein 22 [Pocillopora verrucosa]|uniref:golgin subfamily A member 6-like protein 22 n=1 Tax=Pocillopora verrucosa TaxID=203993 RepID=UPI00333E8FD4